MRNSQKYDLSIPFQDVLYLKGENVIICSPDFGEKFSPIMGYVTFACLGLSMVCLVRLRYSLIFFKYTYIVQ